MSSIDITSNINNTNINEINNNLINTLLKQVEIMLQYIYDEKMYVNKNLFMCECNNIMNLKIIPKDFKIKYNDLIQKIYALNVEEVKYPINYKIRININYYITNLTSYYDEFKFKYGIEYIVDHIRTNLKDMCVLYDIVLNLISILLNFLSINLAVFKNFQLKLNEMDEYVITDSKHKIEVIESGIKQIYNALLIYETFENEFEKNLATIIILNKLKSLNWDLDNVSDILISMYYTKYYNLINDHKMITINNDLLIFSSVVHLFIDILNDKDLIEQLKDIDNKISLLHH